MLTVYKLTTQDNKTRKDEYNECLWGPGVTHSGTGRGGLCGPGYIHAYLSPNLAVLLNPLHGNISNPKLWECSVKEIALFDHDLKVGCVSLTTVRELPLPVITDRQRIIFAILCAEQAAKNCEDIVAGDEKWQGTYRDRMSVFWAWVEKYKAGDAASADYAAADAASAAASAAAYAASDAAYAASAATYAAADAASAAASAADYAAASADYAAASAARSAASDAAYAASDAAYAASAATYAAAYASRAARTTKIDLVAIADLAIENS